mgnify:CR=1 FL=1
MNTSTADLANATTLLPKETLPDWLEWLHDHAAVVTYQRDKRHEPLYTVRVGGQRAVTARRLDLCVAALRREQFGRLEGERRGRGGLRL